VQYQDFDAKLRMTASVLGCSSRKDLVTRFHAVNRSSQCDLDRLHKWLQGRTLPRSSEVLTDWGKVLGSDRSGDWLAGCSLADFTAELARLFGRSADALLTEQAFAGRGSRTARPPAAAQPRMSGLRYLCGTYACYSLSWSPYARGKLVRGGLVLAPGRGTSLFATYSETLMGKPVRVSGEPVIARRTLHMTLIEAGGEIPIFFSLFLPQPPAGVMSGVMAGATFLSPEPEPSASRVVMVRTLDDAPLDGSNRYMAASASAVAEDIANLGLHVQEPDKIRKLLYDFLVQGSGVDQVDPALQSTLSAAFDPVHLRGADEG
jgi:hypothetical protein